MNKKITILACIVAIVSFIVFSFKLNGSYALDGDFARDMYDILTIASGKFSLLGPKLSFGGIYSGPWYYYLFIPVFILSKHSIASVLFFNAFLCSGALGYFYYAVRKQHSTMQSLSATAIIATLPLYVFCARNPGNAFTYMPFLLILLTVSWFSDIRKPWQIFIYGFLAGIISNFHLVAGIVCLFLFFRMAILLKPRRNILFAVFGFLIPFAPLVFFELRHNFIMLKNTFVDKSYLAFINNTNLPERATGKANVFENIFFISSEMSPWITLPGVVWLLTLIGLMRATIGTGSRLFALVSISSFLLLTVLLRNQYAFHYFLPVAFLIVFVSVLGILKTRWWPFLLIVLFIQLIQLPHSFTTPKVTQYDEVSSVVRSTVKRFDMKKTDRFNVIWAAKNADRTTTGKQFRFYFKELGFEPVSEFEYNISDTLFIVTDIPGFIPSSLKTWEVTEFGIQYLRQCAKYKSGSVIVFRCVKE